MQLSVSLMSRAVKIWDPSTAKSSLNHVQKTYHRDSFLQLVGQGIQKKTGQTPVFHLDIYVFRCLQFHVFFNLFILSILSLK